MRATIQPRLVLVQLTLLSVLSAIYLAAAGGPLNVFSGFVWLAMAGFWGYQAWTWHRSGVRSMSVSYEKDQHA